jgi:hypothetical protein
MPSRGARLNRGGGFGLNGRTELADDPSPILQRVAIRHFIWARM